MKFAKLLEMAAHWGIPMVNLLDSSGGRLGYRDVPMAGIDWWFALESLYSGVIPQITVLMGPCIAGQAYCPALCDFLLMSRGSANLWLGGPRKTEAATSEKIAEDVGGADYHMIYSGTCDLVGDDDGNLRLTAAAAALPAFELPGEGRPTGKHRSDGTGKCGNCWPSSPTTLTRTYDMHEVIKVLVDDGEFLEIKDEYAKNLITCFCRFNGEVVGLVANNPKDPGSILEINSCDKYYRFLQVLDAYNIPLVNLVDTPPWCRGKSRRPWGCCDTSAKSWMFTPRPPCPRSASSCGRLTPTRAA